MLIKLENGKPVGHAITNENFYQLFPNTSFPFPLIPQAVEELGYGLYDFSAPPVVGIYEKSVEVSPIKNEYGIWMQSWEIVSMNEQEISEKNEYLRQENKFKAQMLLSQVDFTRYDDVADVNNPPYLVNIDEFKTYRQQLRAIAVNPPITVDEWPVKPEEVWSN